VLITCDLTDFGLPDADVLDGLLRLHLALRRMGGSLRLRHVCPELHDLLALAGLEEVISSA
jgi:hypothetical protein